VAFLATLGALLMGYWTGFAVGSDVMGDTSVTVAAAAEKSPTQLTVAPAAEEATLVVTPVTADAEETQAVVETQAAAPAQPAAVEGLHLQVSAMRNEQAAAALRRELESRGFPVRVEAPAEDALTRVYVGPAANDGDLSQWANELRKEGLEPFPKRL
jgi:cell division septation protein DedD